MKKRMLSLLLALVMVLGMIPLTTMPAEAATITYLDRMSIRVDVPVDGVDLKMNADIWVYSDYIQTGYWDDPPVTYELYWYDADTGKALGNGTKATLGKNYELVMQVTPKSGYAFRSNQQNYEITVNGAEVTPITNGNGSWYFHINYTAIPASKEPLRAYYKDLQLSPYEGNPVEMSVEATGGTNIKYQWYMLVGGGFESGALDWGGALALNDNYCWEGCQTANFKVRSSFGNHFSDGTLGGDVFPIACVVTSDTDSVTLTKLTFSTRERTVVNEATFNDLTIPTYGASPDWSVSSGDSSKYTVTEVKWFGPKTADGSYNTKLISGNTFAEGTYKCRILVSVTDAYKFDENTKATIGKKAAAITTLPGKDLVPMGPDSYYIECEYPVTQNPGFTVQPVGGTVMPGEKLNVQWETNFTPYKTTILAYDAAQDHTSSGYMINPAENSKSFSATALDGSYYQIRAYYTDTKYVTSDKIYVTCTTDYTLEIAGVTVKDGEFFDDDAMTVMKTPSDSSYAYYKNGILYLIGYQDTYTDIVYSIPKLEIQYLGDVKINGIYQNDTPIIKNLKNDLYVWGVGTLDLYGRGDYAVNVEGNVIFGKGSVTMDDANAYAFCYTESVTIKDGGTLYCYCSQGGFFSNGERQISVLDGSLHIYDGGTWYQSIPNNTVIKKGDVYVGNGFDLDQCTAWNGVTNLSSYDSIWIVGTSGSPVTVGGITLYDGDYLSESGGVSNSTLTNNYASYIDGVLTLCNFDYSGIGYEYNENLDYYGLIYGKTPLQIKLIGENNLSQKDDVGTCHGIVATQGVTIAGEGALTLNIDGYGILADQGHITHSSGNLTIKSTGNDGVKTATGDVVISGGSLSINTDYTGINAYRDVFVTGGKVTLVADDAIRAKGDFTMKDGNLVIIADWYGVYAGSDVTINGGNLTVYAQGDGIRADYGTATITGGNITLLANCDGIYAYDDEEKTDILIEGGVIRISAKGYSLDAACSNLRINGGDLILYSSETEYDEDYCSMRAYEKIFLGENVHAGASTESNGTLSTYDPAKNDTYDYVVITLRGSDTADLTVNCVGKITYTVSGQTVTVNHSLACKVGYLSGDKYVAITPVKNGDGSYSFTAPAGVTEVLLVVKGDVSGDGKINVGDTAKTYSHVKATAKLTDPIAIFAADVSGDGKINVGDTAKIYSHVKNTSHLTW